MCNARATRETYRLPRRDTHPHPIGGSDRGADTQSICLADASTRSQSNEVTDASSNRLADAQTYAQSRISNGGAN